MCVCLPDSVRVSVCMHAHVCVSQICTITCPSSSHMLHITYAHTQARVHSYIHSLYLYKVYANTRIHTHTHICTHSIDTHHHIGYVHTQAHICTHTILMPTHHNYPEAYIITIMCMHIQTTISSEAFYLLAHDSNCHQQSRTHFHICNVFYSV